MDRIDLPRDVTADRLEAVLLAQFALEHARRRRSYLAHWATAAGLFVWLYAMGRLPHLGILVLGSFAVLFGGFLVALAAEMYDRVRLRRVSVRTPSDD